MGVSRRFLNLIVDDNILDGLGVCHAMTKSLRRIDLTSAQFFQPAGTSSSSSTMETIELPSPSFRFRAGRDRCLPVADGKVLCTGWGRRQEPFLMDADTRQVVTMPTFTNLYSWNHFDNKRFYSPPVTLFVPSAAAGDDDDDDPEGSLFFLKKYPEHDPIKGRDKALGPLCRQFEAFVHRRTSTSSPSKSWRHQFLPPPPYVRDPRYWRRTTKITSYAVVGGGSHICISVDGTGTFIMDTVSHEWSRVGDWTLPFRGKIEYVPELKLWFGLSDSEKDPCLVAADLSALDSGPELVGTWKLDDDDTPDEWLQPRDARLVYLGSGRFCVAKFINLGERHESFPSVIVRSNPEYFAVLTGVEVHDGGGCSGGSDGGGKPQLRVIKHQSTRTPMDTYIEAAF